MNDPVDVLIIGAGASGAAVAWSLADTRMHILCLDQGGWMNPSEYPSTGRDWEAKFYGDWSTSPNIRGRPEDYPVNDDNSPIKVVNFNGVGGSTVMYTAHWPRLHPSDFKVRTLDGVADDWPIDYDALTPFFEENDRMMGVSGLTGDPLSPLTHPPMPPQPLGLSGPPIGKAMNKLGWHWWPSDTTVATMDYEGRARCINLGHCTPACAQGAKASTDITYWPHAIRAGVELKTHCRVREILTNEHGMASGVIYYDKDGVEQFQPAEVVIIACNGVGTPRLLLNGIQFGRGAGPVFEAVASEQKGILPWGADHHRLFRKLNGHRLAVSAICEDLPEEHNRVTLDPVLKDSHGIPAPKIDYTISENSRKMMEHGLARGREILEVAGATDICINNPIPWGGWHLLGTARMGIDPARSVVNEWGRSHDVKNLFIVDGSVFVTSGGVNPTSTIQAIALYVADQMKQRLANLFD
jgi:choline dehydrogenase-like flavoprotein